MFTDTLIQQADTFMTQQARGLLAEQQRIASQTYRQRTGTLMESLSKAPAASTGMEVTLEYPLHIRFLDMKKGRSGKKKQTYAPIYNKYVYGFLKSGVWKWLNAHIPEIMVKAIEDTIKSV